MKVIFILCLVVVYFDERISSTNRRFSDAINHLEQGAFCRSHWEKFETNRYFPSELPEALLPWVWDAVYHPQFKTVTLTTIPTKNCLLEFNFVEDFLSRYPQYGTIQNSSQFDLNFQNFLDKFFFSRGIFGRRK